MDKIRRAFEEACDELSIEPKRLTLAKRDQLVSTVMGRLAEISRALPNTSAAKGLKGRRLPVAARVA